MDRRRFLIIGGVGGAWFLGLTRLWDRYGYEPPSPRLGLEQYVNLGQRAALEAITSNADFYITSKGWIPQVKPAEYRLAFDGLVENAFTLTLDEVKAQPAFHRGLTLECIENRVGGPAIGTAIWRGTALRPLIERARPKREVTSALLHAADGFTTGIPLQRLMREENFLAWEMNGDPLPPAHGYPLRVFFPGKYGMKQPKWLTRIEFLKEHKLGYWEKRGWSDDAERKTRAVIDSPRPRPGVRLTGRRFLLTGYAIAGASGISRVEVSTDGGDTWHEAEIFSNPSRAVWTLWKYEWQVSAAGAFTIRARATDGNGELQTGAENGHWPDGATGYHRVNLEII